jgi:hypothetical protein
MSNWSYFKTKQYTMQDFRDLLQLPADDYIAEIIPTWNTIKRVWVFTFRINTPTKERAKIATKTILRNPAELDFRKPNTNIRSRQQRPIHKRG